MAFETRIPTRHTDTYAATGFVHAGVLLSLTEMAYAEYEEARGVQKPTTTVAVQRETRCVYHAPLPWRDGAIIRLTTVATSDRGFEQEFEIRSARSGGLVATIMHRWAWLDTTTGAAVPIPADVQERFRTG